MPLAESLPNYLLLSQNPQLLWLSAPLTANLGIQSCHVYEFCYCAFSIAVKFLDLQLFLILLLWFNLAVMLLSFVLHFWFVSCMIDFCLYTSAIRQILRLHKKTIRGSVYLFETKLLK